MFESHKALVFWFFIASHRKRYALYHNLVCTNTHTHMFLFNYTYVFSYWSQPIKSISWPFDCDREFERYHHGMLYSSGSQPWLHMRITGSFLKSRCLGPSPDQLNQNLGVRSEHWYFVKVSWVILVSSEGEQSLLYIWKCSCKINNYYSNPISNMCTYWKFLNIYKIKTKSLTQLLIPHLCSLEVNKVDNFLCISPELFIYSFPKFMFPESINDTFPSYKITLSILMRMMLDTWMDLW